MKNETYSSHDLYPIIARTYRNELRHTVENCIRYLKGKCGTLKEDNIRLDPIIQNNFDELMKKIEYDAEEKSKELGEENISTTENYDISRRSDIRVFDEWGLGEIDINEAIAYFNRLYSFLCTEATFEASGASRSIALGMEYENKMLLLEQILSGKIQKFDIRNEKKGK